MNFVLGTAYWQVTIGLLAVVVAEGLLWVEEIGLPPHDSPVVLFYLFSLPLKGASCLILLVAGVVEFRRKKVRGAAVGA